MRASIIITLALAAPVAGHARPDASAPPPSGRDAAATLGRDVPVERGVPAPSTSTTTVVDAVGPGPTRLTPRIVYVGAVRIEGAPAIARSVFADVIGDVLGKQADARTLQALARAVASRARDMGYIFASAYVPQQAVALGQVDVILDPGAVDEIRVTGTTSALFRETLAPIVGRAVLRTTVERQLLLAGDLPGIAIDRTRYVREGRRAVLIVAASEDRQSGSLRIDNFGSRDLGPERLHARYDIAGLLSDGDILTVQGITTPIQPRELGYLSMRYTTTLGSAGTDIGVAAAAGRIRPDYGVASGVAKGASSYVALFVNHPVMRSNAASLWAYGELAALRVDGRTDGVTDSRDSLVTLTLSGSGNAEFAGGRLVGGVGLVQGLGLGGTTRSGDPLASRRDGSARFTKGFAYGNWNRGLGGGYTLRLAFNGQLADRPLLAAQEIGYGGPSYGRGYDFSERFGDNGILGLAELRRHIAKPISGVDWVQVYGFGDGGHLANLRGGYGSGELFSAGGGLRAGIGRFELGAEAAFPLSRPRFETGTRAPRINLSATLRF